MGGELKRKRIIMLCVLLGWMLLIFLFSAQNSTDSASLSSGMLRRLLSLLPGWDALSPALQTKRIHALHRLFRKLGHFTEYAVLGAIAAQTMRACFPTVVTSGKCVRYFLIPACFALLYAVCDEIHQIFVPGRSCEFRDVMIDTSGACLGIVLLAAAAWLLQRHREKSAALSN